MAKPDEIFKIEVGTWNRSTKHLPPLTRYAYLEALIHYRCHEHCKGLNNDSEQLRRICGIDDKELWDAEIFHTVFDNDKFFTMDENGIWQQQKATQDYAKDVVNYNKRINSGTNGALKRWKKGKYAKVNGGT